MSQQETVKCDICNDYEGTNQQVSTHKIHCAKRNAPKRDREQPDRSTRVPFSEMAKKLPLPPDADETKFQYRWMNDQWTKDPARLQKANMAGYELVEGMQKATVGTNEDGSPIRGVLMRIPRKWYEEDKQKKFRQLDKVDEAIQGGTLERQSVDRTTKGGNARYIPDGIKIHSNTSENG